MSNFKQAIVLLVKAGLAAVIMALAYMFAPVIVGLQVPAFTPEESAQAARGIIYVALGVSLILSYLIFRSPLYGWRLIGLVFLVHFGVETFMTQIETLYFNSAVQMGMTELVDLVLTGAVRALIFAPLTVLVFGKLRRPADDREQPQTIRITFARDLLLRLGVLAILYVFVYFLFGYFVAWQWPEIRMYYTGSTDIKPFWDHFADLVRDDPYIFPFQMIRGAFWAALAGIIAWIVRGNRWETALVVALVFSIPLAIPIGLLPNPYMPLMVRQGHFYELLFSMLLYGAIAGWSVTRMR